MNRVTASIESYKARIAERLAKGLVTQAQLDALYKTSDIDFEEYVSFNTVKSLAQAMEKITLDEAMTIYSYLGEGGPEKFNKAPLEVKTALTQWHMELMQWKMGLHRKVG